MMQHSVNLSPSSHPTSTCNMYTTAHCLNHQHHHTQIVAHGSSSTKNQNQAAYVENSKKLFGCALCSQKKGKSRSDLEVLKLENYLKSVSHSDDLDSVHFVVVLASVCMSSAYAHVALLSVPCLRKWLVNGSSHG
eukprot:619788-Amphidinium_carterae.1